MEDAVLFSALLGFSSASEVVLNNQTQQLTLMMDSYWSVGTEFSYWLYNRV